MQNKNTTIIIILLAIIAVVLVVIALKKPKTEVVEISRDDSTLELNVQKDDCKFVPSGVDGPTDSCYIYKNHGFTIGLPSGYVPKEIPGETGPTISIDLPLGYLVYISDATWWEKHNIEGQATYLRDWKLGSTLYKVYKYNNQDQEFYYFRQGNVAYMFTDEGMISHMISFKFVGWN